MVSFVFGSYLSVSINLLNQHFTESFSSLREESFKNFVRLKMTATGEIEVFALGLNAVARNWVCARLKFMALHAWRGTRLV
jgi:hypothetical protein